MPRLNLAKDLFQMIQNKQVAELQALLNSIEDENELKILDKAKDDNGRTLLHAAMESEEVEIFSALMGVDISLLETNRENKTILAVAEERGLQRLAATLRTRQEWQGAIKTFRFNQVVGLINKSFPKIEPASGRDKILFIGATGAGKSTLLNYLNGSNYRVGINNRSGKPYANYVDGVPEIAKPGENIYKSETLYPQVVAKDGLNYVYCDLAGLFDSRGTEKQICAASSANMLAKLPGDIKGLMVLFDIPGFASLKGAAFKKTALALAQIIRMNPELMDTVQFVITKLRPGFNTDPQDIIDEFVDPLLDSLNDDLNHEEQALRFVLLEMKRRAGQILIPDISDRGVARVEIERKLSALIAKRAERYDFLSHDNAQECFNGVLLNVVQGFLNRMQRARVEIPGQINAIQVLIDAENANIENWRGEIAAIDRELGGNFDPNLILGSIADKGRQIAEHNASIETKTQTIDENNRKIAAATRELAGLDTDDMIELEKKHGDISGRPRSYTMKYKSQYPLDRIEPSMSGWGKMDEQQITPEMTSRIEIDPRDGKPCRIYLNDTNAKNGIYESVFTATEGLASVDVLFYARRRDMHVSRIAELKRNLSEYREANEDIRNEISRLKIEIDRLTRAIAADRVQILAGEAQFEVRKQTIQLRKDELLALIAAAEQRIIAYNNSIAEHNSEIDTLKLEVEVNSETFNTVTKIIDVLDLQDEVLLKFQEEYDEYLELEQRQPPPRPRPQM